MGKLFALAPFRSIHRILDNVVKLTALNSSLYNVQGLSNPVGRNLDM